MTMLLANELIKSTRGKHRAPIEGFVYTLTKSS